MFRPSAIAEGTPSSLKAGNGIYSVQRSAFSVGQDRMLPVGVHLINSRLSWRDVEEASSLP
ncbi:hypothetical protein HMPREF0972_01273 [Actinomyces sp. oral taxon 848 str. F0332]|nr:hypothetical protein HMPREF0972_01273 [Actinomyces sp. oral taxon 848 str. F0332]